MNTKLMIQVGIALIFLAIAAFFYHGTYTSHEQFASRWQIERAIFAGKARLALLQFRWLKQE